MLLDKKLMVVSMRYAGGLDSYEWNHFYLSLKEKFENTLFFDFVAEFQKNGREAMEKSLVDKVKDYQPDIMLVAPHLDELTPEFISSLRDYAKVCGFFHDDSWRRNFVKRLAPSMDIFTTSNPDGPMLYRASGLNNAVFLPFGVNVNLFKCEETVKRDIDVSFIGSWHPYREWMLKKLQKSGINVHIYGLNWPNGPVSESEMIDVMQRSKICLNLSNSINYDVRYLLSSPRAIVNTLRSPKNVEQIKGRHFEIPACGALQLSYYVNGLEKLYEFNKEIIVYNSLDEFLSKTKFYLENDSKREQIAKAGHQRTVIDHDYCKRFMNIFQQQGWLTEHAEFAFDID